MNAKQQARYDRLLHYRNAYERMVDTVPDYDAWCAVQMRLLSELMIDVRTNRQPLSEVLFRIVA